MAFKRPWVQFPPPPPRFTNKKGLVTENVISPFLLGVNQMVNRRLTGVFKTGRVKTMRLSDGNGLYLEVTQTSKRWRARYFFEGKEQMLSLGKYPTVSLKEAREKKFFLRQQLSRGINPAAERKKEKEQIKVAVQEEKRLASGEVHPLSMEAIAIDWLEDARKTWKESTWLGEKKRVNKHIIGTWGKMYIQDITPSHVRNLFIHLETTGKYDTLRKVAEVAVRIFNFAIAVGKCNTNPAYSIWKGLAFRRPDPNRSFSTITEPEQVGKLLADLEASMGKKSGLEVKIALSIAPYVFLRPGTLTSGEWSEINFDTAQWNIPGHKMKNHKDHTVPLARQVVKLLKSLHQYTGQGQYLFPSWSKTGYLSTNSLLRAIRTAGYSSQQFTTHGFRHMAVTLLKELGFNHDLIYLQLSHTLETNAAKATYDKAKFLPQRSEMMQTYADYLDDLRNKANES